MQMDETLASVADKMKNFAVVYLVDITEVPDFNAMYELYDPCTVMFFFRNRVRALLLFCLSRVYRLPVTGYRLPKPTRPQIKPSCKVKITLAPTLRCEFLAAQRIIAPRAVTLRDQLVRHPAWARCARVKRTDRCSAVVADD